MQTEILYCNMHYYCYVGMFVWWIINHITAVYICWHMFYISSEILVNLLTLVLCLLRGTCQLVYICWHFRGTCQLVYICWHLFYVSSEVRVILFTTVDTCFMSLQRYLSTCRLGVATETYGADSRMTKELPYSR